MIGQSCDSREGLVFSLLILRIGSGTYLAYHLVVTKGSFLPEDKSTGA